MLKDLISGKKGLFLDNVHTELRAHENRKRQIMMVSGNISRNVRSETSGVSARVYKNGVYGFSSVADYNDEAITQVLKAASNNANFMDKHLQKNRAMYPSINNNWIKPKSHIDEVQQKEYIEYLKQLDNYIVKKYPNLSGRTLYVTEDSMEKIICTSDGYDGHVVAPRSYVYVFLNSKTDDGKEVELFKAFGGQGTFNLNFTNIEETYKGIDELYEQLMQKREGVYPDAGYKTVILSGNLAGMVAHEAVGHTVEADMVLGGSVAAHNLNKRVGSDLVTLVDFAHTAFGETAPLPVYIDDEGVKAEDCVIIKNGILTEYMNSRDSAQQLNMTPRGNARAFSFSDEPLIRMRNTAILPGNSSLEEMIASIDDGYYFTDTGNGQADMTGEFMFGVTMGYEIKKGKLGKAILDTTISGVAFDMLKTVDMLSNKVSWESSGFCGKKQPMPVGLGGPDVRCKIMIGGH